MQRLRKLALAVYAFRASVRTEIDDTRHAPHSAPRDNKPFRVPKIVGDNVKFAQAIIIRPIRAGDDDELTHFLSSQ
jgi:hypothetical protein